MLIYLEMYDDACIDDKLGQQQLVPLLDLVLSLQMNIQQFNSIQKELTDMHFIIKPLDNLLRFLHYNLLQVDITNHLQNVLLFILLECVFTII